MTVKESSFAEIRQFANRAAKDRVSISDTKKTTWFTILTDKDVIGIAGLMLLPNSAARIKGVWVKPDKRGYGIGTELTLHLVKLAKQNGVKRLEALAYNPTFYESHGWYKVGKPRPNGAQGVEVML